MTRILHVLDHSLPQRSGYAFRTRAIMRAQIADGHEVRAITGLRQRTAEAAGEEPETHADLLFHRTPGLSHGRTGWREWRDIAALSAAMGRVCDDWRPHVLHAHSPMLCGLAAARVAKARGLPLVYEIRAFWEDAAVGDGGGGTVRYWLTRKLENTVIAAADGVVTICKGLRDDLVARGVAPEKLTVVPNGVDRALFGAPGARDAALARELGFDDGPVIGFIGSLHRCEGIDDLIAAMPAIVVAHPAVKLLLVGGGPCEAALRAQAETSPARQAIRFVGRVPHEDVERYYSLIDVVAYPRKAMRLTELVTPLEPLEAMARGKIVAASDVGGHRELIPDALAGTLFAPDDPVYLASALAMLLWRHREWDHQRIAARRLLEREHDWARIVWRYRDVYRRALGRTGSETVPA